MNATATVLLADRSMVVRTVLRRLLEEAPGISVIADVEDGSEAARLAGEKKPLVVILDLDLPSLNGRALVERITAVAQVPIFVLAPKQSPDSARMAMRMSHLGVAAVFPKPETPLEWRALGKTLCEAVREVGSRTHDVHHTAVMTDDTAQVIDRRLRFVGIGASTGGPGAIYELLSAIGPRATLGIAIVQHIADGFETDFTEWLAAELAMDVAVARHGEHLKIGVVRVAPAGHHLTVDRGGRLRLDQTAAPVRGHRPSVEILFRSLLGQQKNRVAAVLLSGMGSDGAEAMAELRRANVLTMAQDEASCAVFGMPRAAIERRAAAFVLAPRQIGRLLARAGGARR